MIKMDKQKIIEAMNMEKKNGTHLKKNPGLHWLFYRLGR
jgi:hypothetical protein